MNPCIFKPLGRHIIPFLIVLTVPALSGCDDVHSRLRTFFHPEESPQGFDGDTGITLQIEPKDELEIFLDGEFVGSESPYSARFLPAGKHQFVLKAAGFSPLALALNLEAGRHITIPIELRALEAGDTPKPHSNAAGAASGPNLPQDIKPVALKITNSFGAQALLDGETAGDTITLNRTWGSLTFNDLRFSYRFDQFGRLEIVIPASAGSWKVGGQDAIPGSAHHLDQRGLKISVQTANQSPRSVSLSRP